MDPVLKQVHKEDAELIKEKILKGVVLRTSTLLLVWSFIASFYAVVSLDLFHHVLPKLTLWDNLWPRLIFNSVPSLLLAYWYKKYEVNTKLKAYATVIVLPGLMVFASLIHAWPAIFKGNYDFYLYFHATNIIAMSSGLAVISAPPYLVIAQALGFLIVYFGPLIYLFAPVRPLMPQLIVSDVVMISIILYVGLKAIYDLRVKLALEDLQRRHAASPFLGENLTRAIYESKDMKFQGYSQPGLIMAVDLRGYTNFIHSLPTDVVKNFMGKFHSLASRIITQHNGYLHKTSGDGLLISFGVMEKEEDLSDIPGISAEENLAAQEKRNSCLHLAYEMFAELAIEFEALKASLNINSSLVVGAGLAYGPIEVIVRGDEKFRQELDIDGEPIVKAVRLESYSKLLNKMVDPESSFLILEPELGNPTQHSHEFKIWLTEAKEQQVRDFPNIKSILYRQWKHKRVRSGLKAA